MAAKLQHPLGVAYNAKDHLLYVADTYNHKIKMVDLSTNTATTCIIKDLNGALTQFNEPGGLCVSPKCDKLYIANTNNHTIEVVSLEDFSSETIKLQFTFTQSIDLGVQLKSSNIVKVSPTDGGQLKLFINLQTAENVKLTDGAPQKWSIILPNNNDWTTTSGNGPIEIDENNKSGKFTIDLNAAENIQCSQEQQITITCKLSLCATNADICYPKTFSIIVPVVYDTTDGLYDLKEIINVTITEADVHFT